jgi:hypothetical protein
MLGVEVGIGEITTKMQMHAKNDDIGNEGVGERLCEWNSITQ